ncbi:bacterial transferase hexapeptiderepeat-containing protein [Striga asiatica]|uniref:Bacterial transferase hexapeptiderepeat-containing protein n=1 Tax=Striga asiatica TaxID=4170 RepID=A0A5A7R3N8_STRAF|nr:bacterial transferase hexapeptiderepeat-containing protein [Striga asiatica]
MPWQSKWNITICHLTHRLFHLSRLSKFPFFPQALDKQLLSLKIGHQARIPHILKNPQSKRSPITFTVSTNQYLVHVSIGLHPALPHHTKQPLHCLDIPLKSRDEYNISRPFLDSGLQTAFEFRKTSKAASPFFEKP